MRKKIAEGWMRADAQMGRIALDSMREATYDGTMDAYDLPVMRVEIYQTSEVMEPIRPWSDADMDRYIEATVSAFWTRGRVKAMASKHGDEAA